MINGKKINNISPNCSVLVTPLEWGLGHATRCIPIINELLLLDCNVIIAASEKSFFLLKKEFPNIVILRISGYKIRYTRNRLLLPFALFFQLPRIFYFIKKEKRWLTQIIKEHSIDAVISDNRFGMYNKNVFSVFMTHQLLIRTGNIFTEKLAQKINFHFIKKFNACWVPDYADNGLAGNLSHPSHLPANTFYIGPLSRFKQHDNLPVIFDLLISLSGPEPQRTIFENELLVQLKNTSKKVLLIRGLPGEKKILKENQPLLKIVNHLSAEDLNKAFLQAEVIICRSGYTTIMDLVKINKKAILVPTPGQTEQEYLADYLLSKKYFYSVKQQNFSIPKAVREAKDFSHTIPHAEMENYKKVLTEFVLSLKSGKFTTQ